MINSRHNDYYASQASDGQAAELQRLFHFHIEYFSADMMPLILPIADNTAMIDCQPSSRHL